MYEWRKMSPEERERALSERKRHGCPWHKPLHLDFGEGVYHLSAACFEHAPIVGLSPARLEIFESELLAAILEEPRSSTTIGPQSQQTAQGVIHAWCVLPNHYHLLMATSALRAVKHAIGQLHGRTSHRWNGEEDIRGRTVWYQSSDRGIRSDRHFWATMNYIHHNPVRHGYVTKWQEWPFSSASSFLAQVGPEEAKRIWKAYPLLDYGEGWDDPDL